MAAKNNKLRDSLVKQIEYKKANVEHFTRLIDDYVFYDLQEGKAQKNIEKNGTTIETTSASGYPIFKENPDIKSAIMFNKQKLAILKQMNLNTDDVGGDEVDEEM